MLIQTEVGKKNVAPGTNPSLRSDRNGALVVVQGSAKYAEETLNGDVYIGANPAGTPVTTQAGLSATTPALVLYNPVGSGVNLILKTVTVDITTSPAAAAGLMLAYNTQNSAAPATVTNATITNAVVGIAKQPVGKCYAISTLNAAPIAFRYIGGTTGASGIGAVQLIDHVDGEVVIPPGVNISIQATSAVAILASFTWSEQPL